MKFVTNSPDTNVLDLCFFRSLGKLVSKDERKFQQGYLGKQAFWKHVVKTFHAYHTKKETMDRCWRLKSAVIKSILDANGWNDYELPHGYDECKPTVQDNEPLARALTFEDAEGVLPCSGSLSHDKKVQKFARARFPRYVQYCGASQAYVKFCNPR